MSHAPDYSYLGSGIVLLRLWGATSKFEEVGNCSAFGAQPTTNRVTLADYTNPGGGTRNGVDRVTDWTHSYTFHDFNGGNFARATRGKASTVATGAVSAEPHYSYKGSYVPLRYPASAVSSVEPVGGGTPYTAGTDYILDRGMLWIPPGSTITDATSAANIEVDYTRRAHTHVEGAVTAQQYYEMQFHGANEARSGKEMRFFCHKVSGGVIDQLQHLGDQFGAGTVSGLLNADPAKAIDSDTSRYFYWQVTE